MTEKQTCPRRMLDHGPWERTENLDTWRNMDATTAGRSCSFCGSMHPDDFMRLVAEGHVVGPTDKNYKAYISGPVTNELIAERKAKWLKGDMATAIHNSLTVAGASEAAVTKALADEWTIHQSSIAGPHEGKFYYQHLSVDQRRQFVEHYNASAAGDETVVDGAGATPMRVGYPGHFYQLPFFMVLAQ